MVRSNTVVPNQVVFYTCVYIRITCNFGYFLGDRSPPKNYLFTDRKILNFGYTLRRGRRPVALTAVSHHVSVVSPRSKLHGTSLFVERKVFHVYFTKRFVNGRWLPYDFSRVMQYGLRHNSHFVISIGTVKHAPN